MSIDYNEHGVTLAQVTNTVLHPRALQAIAASIELDYVAACQADEEDRAMVEDRAKEAWQIAHELSKRARITKAELADLRRNYLQNRITSLVHDHATHELDRLHKAKTGVDTSEHDSAQATIENQVGVLKALLATNA